MINFFRYIRRGAPNSLRYWQFFLLFITLPTSRLMSFLLRIFSNGNYDSIVSYSYFFLFLFLFLISNIRNSVLFLILVGYFLFYVFFWNYDGPVSAASYMIRIVFVIYCLLLFRNVSYKKIDLKYTDRFIVTFSYVFLIIYIVTIYLHPSGIRIGGERIYLQGFMIPHEFSYQCSILIIYLLWRKPFIYSVPLIITGLAAGARSGALLIIFSLVYYLFFVKMKKIKANKRLVLYTIITICLLLFLLFYIEVINETANRTFLELASGSYDKKQDFSSGRTVVWYFAINDIISSGLSYLNLIGRGPNSSFYFNELMVGNHIWMHNDFVEIIFSLGIIGLFIYLYALFKFYKSCNWNLYIIFFISFSAITNGFFYYNVIQVLLIFCLINQKLILKQESL